MQKILSADRLESGFTEGYVYNSYGKIDYLKHVIASVYSLRRYDKERPVALFCDQNHEEILKKHNLINLFDFVGRSDPKHRSIIGFKHNIDKYMVYSANLFLDSDIIWCKNPDRLWNYLSLYPFTITGTLKSDIFFGTHKNFRVLSDILLNKREKTLRRFGLTYLSRVQSGLIYARDYATTKAVCKLATHYMEKKHLTHFTSRILPNGGTEESDEWGFAMAMSRKNLPVIPWHQGKHSPQLDFVSSYVKFDPDFRDVKYLYFNKQFMNNLRGVRSNMLRNSFKHISQLIMPSSGDHLWVTPYSLHFSWKHEKKPFENFAKKVWLKLTHDSQSVPTLDRIN